MPATSKQSSQSVDFEKALQELEALVEKLESGDLSLEASLKQFERGISLTRACQKALQQAEQKVQTLTEGEEQGVDGDDATHGDA